MADVNSRRNSKIATPKPSGSPALQPLADPLETLSRAIGARVKVSTIAPFAQNLEGILFTADPILNLLAIDTRPETPGTASKLGDFHLIPVSRIQNFQIVNMAPAQESFAAAQPAIGRVDVKQLQAREEAAIARAQEKDRDRGKGVTAEGQDIYDSFKRINMAVRWHNQEMIVQDAVIIAHPYRVEDCKGPKDKQEAVNRVKKVLEGERRKLKEKADRKAAAAAAPHKGG